MTEETTPATIRLPRRLLAELKAIAHKRSLTEQQEVKWTDITKKALQEIIDAEGGHHATVKA